MVRRNFLATSAAALSGRASFAEPSQPIIKPRALRRGDTIGLITPSTHVSDSGRLEIAARRVSDLGLIPKMGKNVGKRKAYLGGTIDERLDDLHAAFADPEVRAVFCIRGGYGALQLLDRIDYSLVRRNPKIFVGYSDITTLHLAINKMTGLITFHGPMMISAFTDYTIKYFRRALFEPAPLGVVTNPSEAARMGPAHKLLALRPGIARGTLIGGNLSLISALMGTPFEIETRGRILLVEDVSEQPYEIDRMLTQLRLAGKLDHAAGIIFGECANCMPRVAQKALESSMSLREVLNSALGKLKIPVLSGAAIGHTEDQLTLPLGTMASLNADTGELTIEESATLPAQ